MIPEPAEGVAPESSMAVPPLPLRVKAGWGIGGVAESVMANGLPTMVNPIYNIALGLDPARLGFIGSAPRFLDAIFDIWLGSLSENAR